jgi:hypothetical protein
MDLGDRAASTDQTLDQSESAVRLWEVVLVGRAFDPGGYLAGLVVSRIKPSTILNAHEMGNSPPKMNFSVDTPNTHAGVGSLVRGRVTRPRTRPQTPVSKDGW